MPSLDDLVRQRWLKPENISRGEVQLALERAKEELAAARQIAGGFPSSAYELAYNAMLLGVTALMYAAGFRARVEQHHKTLVDFAEARLGPAHASLVGEFEQARRKRHRTIYGQVKVARREAEHALRAAQQLLALVEGLLSSAQTEEEPKRGQDGT